jgi:hypothetical protein
MMAMRMGMRVMMRTMMRTMRTIYNIPPCSLNFRSTTASQSVIIIILAFTSK